MNKAEVDKILDRHFALLQKIKDHYRDRDKVPSALDKAIRCCQEQIALAPQAAVAFEIDYRQKDSLPAHTGFEQLAVIREKQGDFVAAIELCEEAKRQGWGQGCTKGPVDWDKRINRCKGKLEKQAKEAPQKHSHTIDRENGVFHVECPTCKEILRIPLQYAGQSGNCRKCQGTIVVPGLPV